MSCELELEGRVATLRTIVREPELEGIMLEQRDRLAGEVMEEVGGLLAERFNGRIEISYVSIEPAGSIAVLVVLSTVGHLVIEYGALMAGLRELSRLIPGKIRRNPLQAPRAPGIGRVPRGQGTGGSGPRPFDAGRTAPAPLASHRRTDGRPQDRALRGGRGDPGDRWNAAGALPLGPGESGEHHPLTSR
jgi:hypothetical protein